MCRGCGPKRQKDKNKKTKKRISAKVTTDVTLVWRMDGYRGTGTGQDLGVGLVMTSSPSTLPPYCPTLPPIALGLTHPPEPSEKQRHTADKKD